MKTSITYLLLIIASLSFASCHFLNERKDKSKPENITESEADKIITYTNSVIDMLAEQKAALKKALGTYYRLEKGFKDKKTDFSNDMLSYKNIFVFADIKKPAKSGPYSPVLALGKDQQFFKDTMSLYRKLFDEFRKQHTALETYIKAQDYKDDNYAKGKSLIQAQYDLYDSMSTVRQAIYDKIEKIADSAEEVALKDSPIREAYRVAKSDLNKAEDLVVYISGLDTTVTKTQLSEIEAKFNDLQQSALKDKDVNKVKLKREKRDKTYNDYYNHMNNKVIPALKAVIRNLKSTKVLSDDDYDMLSEEYEEMIRKYNAWVD